MMKVIVLGCVIFVIGCANKGVEIDGVGLVANNRNNLKIRQDIKESIDNRDFDTSGPEIYGINKLGAYEEGE